MREFLQRTGLKVERARRTADDDGLDLEDVHGVGKGGRSRQVALVEALGDVALRGGGAPRSARAERRAIRDPTTHVHKDGPGGDAGGAVEVEERGDQGEEQAIEEEEEGARVSDLARIGRRLEGERTHSSAETRESEQPSQKILGLWPAASFLRRAGSAWANAAA